MKDLLPRLLSGIVFIALMVFGILYSLTTGQLLFGLITFIATYEYFGLSGSRGVGRVFFSLLALFIYEFLILAASLETEYLKVILVVATIVIAISRLFTKALDKRIVGLIHGALVMSVPFAILSVWLYKGHTEVVMFVFILLWVNDSMAYVTGRLMGKTKLMPTVSPGKTWEGFVGGLVFASIVGYFACATWHTASPWMGVLFAVIISIFGTMGDLFESRVKRLAGKKDSGKIMPGHGGLLDRFDGIIICVPILYLIFDSITNLLL